MTPDELRAARKQLGLTQAQLAAELGVHQSTYAKWEAGTFRIAHPEILKLALNAVRSQRSNAQVDPERQSQQRDR